MHFATIGTMSRSDRTMAEAPVFVPADGVQVEFISGGSATRLPVPAKTHLKDTVSFQTAQLTRSRSGLA